MNDVRTRTEELYRRYGAHVQRRCRYLLRNDDAARDAMQEVFVKVLQRYDTFRGDSSPLGWMLAIATHHCLNSIRAQKAPWHQAFRDLVALHGGTTEQGVDRRDLVRALLGRVDAETQAVAVHFFVDEMTKEEVAKAVGLSVPTVRKRILHFVEQARAGLAELAPELVSTFEVGHVEA